MENKIYLALMQYNNGTKYRISCIDYSLSKLIEGKIYEENIFVRYTYETLNEI